MVRRQRFSRVAWYLVMSVILSSAAALSWFLAPVNVAAVNSGAGEGYPSLSADGLTLYFVSTRNVQDDIWVATRPDSSSPFGSPSPVSELNTGSAENAPSISGDGLSLYFNTDRFTGGGIGRADIYVSTRPDLSSPFGTPVAVAGGVNAPFPSHDSEPFISKDGLALFFQSNRAGGLGGHDIWAATRPDTSSPFGAAFDVAEINSPFDDGAPTLTGDGRTIFFSSDRTGGSGGQDIWMATRPDVNSPFGTPVLVTSLNSGSNESSPDISADGCLAVFTSDRPGSAGGDIWLADSALPTCAPEILVVIDIKPGSFPNSINLGSAGTITVAILSSETFDATTVNPSTVTLVDAGVRLRGKGALMASLQDVNGDGRLDLVVHVSTQALHLSDTDTVAVLKGKTFAGTSIRGSDSVRIIP